jgi:hypothetical protein
MAPFWTTILGNIQGSTPQPRLGFACSFPRSGGRLDLCVGERLERFRDDEFQIMGFWAENNNEDKVDG